MRRLFVGGPHDGQVHEVADEPELYRLVNPDAPVTFIGDGPCEVPDLSWSTYRRVELHGAGGVYLGTEYHFDKEER